MLRAIMDISGRAISLAGRGGDIADRVLMTSYQVVETYRDGGKVKLRVLANLGRHTTVEAALDEARQLVARGEQALACNEAATGWKAHRGAIAG